MSRKQNRILNLQALAAEHGLTAVAERAGSSYLTLWQIVSGTPLPIGKPRGLGDELARRIEKAFDQQAGWLDRDPTLSHTALEIAQAFSRLSPERQVELAGVIKAAIGPAFSDEQVEEKMPITAHSKERRQ